MLRSTLCPPVQRAADLSSRNKWKSNGAKFGLYGGCFNVSNFTSHSYCIFPLILTFSSDPNNGIHTKASSFFCRFQKVPHLLTTEIARVLDKLYWEKLWERYYDQIRYRWLPARRNFFYNIISVCSGRFSKRMWRRCGKCGENSMATPQICCHRILVLLKKFVYCNSGMKIYVSGRFHCEGRGELVPHEVKLQTKLCVVWRSKHCQA